jgi:NAD(P)-dependent dehydrogenase (short-subunit alcohol dehydrogenase family)
VDLADETSIVRACAQVISRYGAPWVLVNNAGVQDRELLLESTAGEWDRTHAINARGPFLMTREIAGAMAAGGLGGRIVNIGSAALVGSLVKGLAAYSASKGALLGLSRASAFELVDHAITVNTVLPGGVATPGAIGAKGPAAEGPARRRPPLGTCEPRDIGAAVLFFASPAARYITNQVLTVDGGWSVT